MCGFMQFLTLAAIFYGGQEGHDSKSQEKSRENAAKDNEDAHGVTSLQFRETRR